MEPSSISVVDTREMVEVARIDTGIMPHGGRFGRDHRYFYSVNMMDDQLVELDAHEFAVHRVLNLSEHAPKKHADAMHGKPAKMDMKHGGKTMHGKAEMDMKHGAMDHSKMLQPTWVTVPTADGRLYVAGNNQAKILEIDLAEWKITRVFKDTGKGPYNLAVTPDGKTLLATYKKDQSIGIWDLARGEELARPATGRRVPHGVVISPDGRYGFITVEGVGGEPGTVEVFHIATAKRVASVEIGKQAGGIAFWKMGR
jgi:hypothetical protein